MSIQIRIAGLAVGALLSLGVVVTPAHATVYDWSFTATSPSLGGAAFTGNGTLTTSDTASGKKANTSFAIISVTGDFNGITITGLAPADTLSGNDNLLFPDGGTAIDTKGVGLILAGGDEVEIFSFNAPGSTDITPGNNFGEEAELASGSSEFGVGMLTVTPAPVPEPVSLSLVGSGLIGLSLIRRRRASGALGRVQHPGRRWPRGLLR